MGGGCCDCTHKNEVVVSAGQRSRWPKNFIRIIKKAGYPGRRCRMAISGKYGKVNIPRIAEDEPVFILRAQDRLAEPTIEMYKLLAASHGTALANDLYREIDAFRKWSGLKKIPD